jgi:hypothetical protein
VNGTLAPTDCNFDDGSYADVYGITVTANTTVQIDLTSTAFDTWLELYELLPSGSLVQRAVNDDVSPTSTDSQVQFALVGASRYFIVANSFDPAVTGAYVLKVTATSMAAGRAAGTVIKPGKRAAVRLIPPTRR